MTIRFDDGTELFIEIRATVVNVPASRQRPQRAKSS